MKRKRLLALLLSVLLVVGLLTACGDSSRDQDDDDKEQVEDMAGREDADKADEKGAGEDEADQEADEEEIDPNSPEGVTMRYVFASLSANGGRKLVELFPQEQIEKTLAEGYDGTGELVQAINDVLEDRDDERVELYGPYTVRVADWDEQRWRNSAVKHFNEWLVGHDYDMEIEGGTNVKLTVILDGKDDWDSKSYTFSTIQVDGIWYMDLREHSVFGM